MPKTQAIGDRLKAARAKLKLSQSQAAKEWGVNLRSLQGWEISKEPRGLYLKAVEEILRKAGV